MWLPAAIPGSTRGIWLRRLRGRFTAREIRFGKHSGDSPAKVQFTLIQTTKQHGQLALAGERHRHASRQWWQLGATRSGWLLAPPPRLPAGH
jgi:hypothetical protein